MANVKQLLESHITVKINGRSILYLIVSHIINNTRAVDQEDLLSESDILPHLRLSRHRCGFAAGLPHQRIYHARLTRVRIAYHADRYLTLVLRIKMK